MLCSLALCSLTLCSPRGVASAQAEASADALTLNNARLAFREGIEHARAARWLEAREAFERSYALVPRPTTLLNLAGTCSHTGQLLRAAEAYRRFLREAAADDPHRGAALAELASLEVRIPRVRVEHGALGPSLTDASIDGETVSPDLLTGDLLLDPGLHRIEASAGAREASLEVSLAEGERRTLTLTALALPLTQSGLTQSGLTQSGLTQSGSAADGGEQTLWIVLGVGALVVIGAGVAVGVTLSESSALPWPTIAL